MYNDLSAIKYIKNNKQRVSVLIISLSLFIMLIYCMGFILSASFATFKNVCVSMPDKLVYIESTDFNADSTPTQLKNSLSTVKESPTVDNAFVVGTINARVQPAIGSMSFTCPLTTKENIPLILKHMNATLLEGTLPITDGDMVIDRKLCMNLGYKLGDEIKPGYHIVGIVDSDYYLCTGINFEVYENSILVLSNTPDVNYSTLTTNLPFTHTVSDGITGRSSYNNDVINSIRPSSNLITITTLLMLSICLVVVINMYIKDRHEEWCLYHSIGYSIRSIYLMALRELLITIMISLLIGILLSTIGVVLIYQLLFVNNGLLCSFLLPSCFFEILTSMLFILGICQIPIYLSLQQIRTIDALESQN